MLRFWKKKPPESSTSKPEASPGDSAPANIDTTPEGQLAKLDSLQGESSLQGEQSLIEAYRREREELEASALSAEDAARSAAQAADSSGASPAAFSMPEVVPVTSMMPEPVPPLTLADVSSRPGPVGDGQADPAAPAADTAASPARPVPSNVQQGRDDTHAWDAITQPLAAAPSAELPSASPAIESKPEASAVPGSPPSSPKVPIAGAMPPPLPKAPMSPPSLPSVAATPPATGTMPPPLPKGPPPLPPKPVPAASGSWRERLSGSTFTRNLRHLFQRNPRLDDELLDDLETCLLTADVGVNASTRLVEDLRKRMHKREFVDATALLDALRNELAALVRPLALDLPARNPHGPFVILVVGVNGVGKTTTIGKLAHHYRGQGRKVMLAAGDTFRAAAVEQLKNWGQRNEVPVISQGQDADSASVIFDAVQAAKARNIDVLIADTAGRLHTQANLMEELRKIRRVIARVDPGAPHEVLQIIDGTTGQNAIAQVKQFREAAGVSGLVVTKLDGTAKGGVVFALAREFGLPLRFVGVGEKREDLRSFDASAFVAAMVPDDLGKPADEQAPS